MVIAVVNPKGGVGKTTTAIALATAITRKSGAAVTVVDADPKQDAFRWVESSDFERSQKRGASSAPLINAQAIYGHDQQLSLGNPLDGASSALKEAIADTREHSDQGKWTIVDAPAKSPTPSPSNDLWEAALSACDFAIIPTSANPMDLRWAIVAANESKERSISYGILLANVRPGIRAVNEVKKALERANLSYFDSVIAHREIVGDYYGQPLPFDDSLFGYMSVYQELQEC